MTIPLWREVDRKREFGAALDPVEQFVFDHWPCEPKEADEPWRAALGALVEYVAQGGVQAGRVRSGSIVSVAPGLQAVMVRLDSGVTGSLAPGMRVTVAEAPVTRAAG